MAGSQRGGPPFRPRRGAVSWFPSCDARSRVRTDQPCGQTRTATSTGGRKSTPETTVASDLPRLVLRQMRLEEGEDARERVTAVLALLPAVALVVVPLDLVDLVLDLQGLDHALGHERRDPL